MTIKKTEKLRILSKMVFEQGKLYERLKWEAKIEKIKKETVGYVPAGMIKVFLDKIDKIVEKQKWESIYLRKQVRQK